MEIQHTNWYVLHAPDTKIHEVVHKLRLMLGEENVIFPTAQDRKLNKKSKIFVEKTVPIYFNYVFVKLGETDRAVEDLLQRTISSHLTILCMQDSKKWCKLTEEELKNIKRTMSDAKKEGTSVSYDYKVGDYVKILIGPFRLFNGTVESIHKIKRTAIVTVHVFGREVPVEVDIEGVEKTK